MAEPCPLCVNGVVILEAPWQHPITRRVLPAGARVRCDHCGATGTVEEPGERLWRALDGCNRAQRAMVADALATLLDDLAKRGAHSPACWAIAGLLDGEAPVTEESKRQAASGIRKARAV